MDGIWLVYLFLAAFPGLIVVAAVYKYMEVSEAARWPSTQGRIVVSKSTTREVSAGGPDSEDTEPRNFASIVYQYTVAGRTHRCDRVSIGENMGDFEVAETLARYPVGKTVTVHYDPREHGRAVLEREAPPGIWKAITIMVLAMIGLIVGSIVGFHKLGDLVARLVPNSREAPFVSACIGFALLAALVIFGIHRSIARMRHWPTVKGRIESAAVKAFEMQSDDGSRSRWVTRYRPNVSYGYEVKGVRYTGHKTGTTARVSSNIASAVRPRYAKGTTVTVHYNPDNPAEAIVDPCTGPLWLLWLVPAAMLVLAWLVGS